MKRNLLHTLTLSWKKTTPAFCAQGKWYVFWQRDLKQPMVAPPFLSHTMQSVVWPRFTACSTFISAPFIVSYTSYDHSAQFRCTHLSTSRHNNLASRTEKYWIVYIAKESTS